MIKCCFTCVVCCLGLLTGFSAAASPIAPAQPTMPGEAVSLGGGATLSLDDAVLLGLSNNGEIRAAYLERTAQKLELQAAEGHFTPKLALNGRHIASQNQDDRFSQTELSPSASLRSETGAHFSLSWNNRIIQGERGISRNDGASFTVIQPLMRGAGRDVVTAPLRLARLGEQINRLNLKATVSNTVTQIIIAYNEVLRAQEQSRLGREALARVRRLWADNFYMAAAGFQAEFDFADLVQIDAAATNRELALEEVGNRLDSSRLRLLRLLALDLDTKIHASDALEVRPAKIGLAKALAAAREQQPSYLMQILTVNRATVELAVARDMRQWDVSLVGGASQTRSRVQGAGGYQTSEGWENHAGIRVDIPLGDSTPRQAEVRARVNAQNQNSRLADARQALERDVNDAVRDLNMRWKQYEIAQRALELSRHKLEIERDRSRAARPDSFRVLAFESDLHNAELARLDSLIAYRNAQATLDRVLGTTLDSWDINLND